MINHNKSNSYLLLRICRKLVSLENNIDQKITMTFKVKIMDYNDNQKKGTQQSNLSFSRQCDSLDIIPTYMQQATSKNNVNFSMPVRLFIFYRQNDFSFLNASYVPDPMPSTLHAVLSSFKVYSKVDTVLFLFPDEKTETTHNLHRMTGFWSLITVVSRDRL